MHSLLMLRNRREVSISSLFIGASCGTKPASSRIVGGIQAQTGEWPWQALLASAGGSQFCGGSLIADQWVLTASHCVEGTSASQIVVRLVLLITLVVSIKRLCFKRLCMYNKAVTGTLSCVDLGTRQSTIGNRHSPLGLLVFPTVNLPDLMKTGSACKITVVLTC